MRSPQAKYNSWWLGKLCRVARQGGEFKRVIRVRLVGPPSFFYGTVWLDFEDGSDMNVITDAYTPRKSDVEVLAE